MGFDSTQHDTEVDGDHEVAEMKIRYDAKLKLEEETALQLMHLHAVMTKAHDTLVKDSNQQKVEIKRLRDKEARLYETIHSLEKDIQSHKKEIREREETITDKEKRIFELKKKNQVSLFCIVWTRARFYISNTNGRRCKFLGTFIYFLFFVLVLRVVL